ncbi:unnamed protein product [Dovyalis caffra]|uniref:Uncharacterized protein n=1 Tax=Dovyalis caffra TaxID=77055 RepID=A0AAV1R900_9ROSI|nr:unnamed protein product [Dovyalis caffra]
MAFLLTNSSISSHFRSQSQNTQGALSISRRGFHVEPGPREQAALGACLKLEEAGIAFKHSLHFLSQCNLKAELLKFLLLLAEDPALKRFKSYKKSVWKLKRVGDALTLVVVAGCCYEIYVKAVMREAARKQAKESA